MITVVFTENPRWLIWDYVQVAMWVFLFVMPVMQISILQALIQYYSVILSLFINATLNWTTSSESRRPPCHILEWHFTCFSPFPGISHKDCSHWRKARYCRLPKGQHLTFNMHRSCYHSKCGILDISCQMSHAPSSMHEGYTLPISFFIFLYFIYQPTLPLFYCKLVDKGVSLGQEWFF